MEKLYFRYGAMGSCKTANAIMVWYNYQERCKKALLIKPGVDTRDGVYTINELLRGDTSFWYDADNHQLYVRDRSDTGQ